MAQLSINNTIVIIAANTKVLFIDSLNNTLIKTLELPPLVNKNKKPGSDNENDEENPPKISSPASSENRIEHMTLSPNGQLLALTTSIDKILYLYRYTTLGETELLSARDLTRLSSALRFSNDSNELLIAEKTGDCYLFDCIDVEKPGTWLLGHLSIVLDIMFTNDKKFILTCDRDEKIRLTNYPKTHLIEAYGLGHTEYVSSLELLPTHPDELLVSISGDKMLKIWQLSDLKSIFQCELTEEAGLKIATKKVNDLNHLAISHVDSSNVSLLELKSTEDESTNWIHWSMQMLSVVQFNDSKCITNLMFNDNGDLILLGLSEKGQILMYKLLATDYTRDFAFETNCNKIIQMEFESISSNLDVSTLLFKKRFNNLEDYHERKKRRIDEKNKRK